MKDKILALLLAFIMVLGTFSPSLALAAKVEDSSESLQLVSQGINEKGKLSLNLNIPEEDQSSTLFGGLELGGIIIGDRVGAGEDTNLDFGQTKILVSVEKIGIGNSFFNFNEVFKNQTVKLSLVDDETGDPLESHEITNETKELKFDKVLSMDDIKAKKYVLELDAEGTGTIYAQLYVEKIGAFVPGEETGITSVDLKLYQVRNSSFIVKTVGEDGNLKANPASTSVGSKLKFSAGDFNDEIYIPENSDPVNLLVRENRPTVETVASINKGLNFSFTQMENNVLVDSANNKIYKVKEIYVDQNGINPSVITLVEKPQVSTDSKYATDPDYVKVDFSAGKYGEITGTEQANHSVYYVFRNTTLANTLTPPEVTANDDFTLKTEGTWEPELKTKYDQSVTHVAQYSYDEDIVPQNPMEPKPSVPDDYVMVTFMADEHGSIKDFDKTIYWVNPDAIISFLAQEIPGTTPENGYHFDAWYVGTEKQDPTGSHQYTENTRYTAKFESDISDTEKEGFVKVTFKPGENGKFNPVAEEVFFYIKSGKDVNISAKEPTVVPNAGYIHNGWKSGSNKDVNLKAVNINADAEFTAQYKYDEDISATEKPGYAKVTFAAGEHGKLIGRSEFWVNPAKSVELPAPYVQTNTNYEHNGWEATETDNQNNAVNITIDGLTKVSGQFAKGTTITASYEELISDTQKEGFVEVTFNTGTNGTIKGSTDTTKTVYVKPNVQVDLTDKAPEVTAKEGKKFMTWDKGLVATFTEATTINAVYNDTISDTKVDGYTEIKFVAGTNGKFKDGDTEKSIWIDPEIAVDLNAKADELKALLVADVNYSFKQWENPLGTAADFTAKQYDETTTFTAAYESNVSDTEKDGFIEVKFLPGENGKFSPEADSKSVWVKPNVEVDLNSKAPTVVANENYDFTGWNEDLKGTFSTAKDITAQYEELISDTTKEGFNKVTFKPGTNGKLQGTEQEKSVWVKPGANVDLTAKAPTVIANTGYSHKGWSRALKGIFENNAEIIATYEGAISDTKVAGWTEIIFDGGDHGKFGTEQTKSIWVNPDVQVDLTNKARGIANSLDITGDYKFDKWMDGGQAATFTPQKYAETKTFTAAYTPLTAGQMTVTATKKWVGELEGETRPEIHFQLYKTVDGTTEKVGDPVKVEGTGDNITVDFGKQDIANSENKAYTYSVKEVDAQGEDYTPDGYTKEESGLTVTNTVKAADQFTIKYLSMDTNMGTVTEESETVTSADQIAGSTAKAEQGYEFVRWMDVENPTNTTLTNATLTPTEAKNATYIAIFKATEPEPMKEFTIWYVPSDSTMGSVSLDKETVVENATSNGSTASSKDTSKYQFVKWIDADGKDVSTDAKLTPNVTESTVFVAVFKKIPVKPVTHTVSFDANGGEGSMKAIEVLDGDYTLPLSSFTRKDYNFVGWKVGDEGNTLKAGETITVTKDITLYAQWEEIQVTPEPTEKVTINYKFEAKDGSRLPSRVMNLIPKKDFVEEGTTVEAPVEYDNVRVYDNDGYWTFVKWSPEKFDNVKLDSTYTFVGTWKWVEGETPTPNPDTFKINYISGNPLGGRVSPKSETVNIDSRIEGSTATAYDGYRFVKWTDWDGNIVSRREYFRPSERADATYIAVFERIDTPVEPKPENPSIIYATKTEEVIKEVPVFYDIHDSYIAGYPDGTVRPDGNITRAEVATIFARLTQRQNLAQFTDKFSDVKATDWFMTSVMKLSSKDIINGYPDKTFKPNRNISRAEFAAIASKFIERPTASSETFIDVPTNHWAHDKIAMVKAEGWITGYTDGTFKPDAPITRAEAVTIVNRMFDRAADRQFVKNNGYEITLFKDLSTNHWAYYDIIESTNGHYYKRANGMEDWGKIIK